MQSTRDGPIDVTGLGPPWMYGVGCSGCAPEPVVLGGIRGGELLVAFGALLLAVFVFVDDANASLIEPLAA